MITGIPGSWNLSGSVGLVVGFEEESSHELCYTYDRARILTQDGREFSASTTEGIKVLASAPRAD